MTQIYIPTRAYTESRGGYDPDDEWSRDSTSTSWSFGEPTFKNPKDCASINIDVSEDDAKQDKLFLTVVVWSTGDSFGHDEDSYAEAFSVHRTLEEANKAMTELKNARDILDDTKGPADLGNGYTLAYAPWSGYFESWGYGEIIEYSKED